MPGLLPSGIFQGPHKTLFGNELFLPSGCKTLHAEKEKLQLPKKKKKPSFFVNRFPGSLVEPQVANYRLHSKAVPAFTVNQRSPSLMALGTAFVSWTDWGGGRMVSG